MEWEAVSECVSLCVCDSHESRVRFKAVLASLGECGRGNDVRAFPWRAIAIWCAVTLKELYSASAMVDPARGSWFGSMIRWHL